MKATIAIVDYILRECTKHNQPVELRDNDVYQLVQKHAFARALDLIKANLMYKLVEHTNQLGLSNDELLTMAKQLPELAIELKRKSGYNQPRFTKEQLDQLK